MSKLPGILVLVGTVALTAGCNQQQVSEQSTTPGEAPGSEKYLLAAEPRGAKDVIDVRANAEDEQTVVVTGRIGGSKNPWVEGRAAFRIVDSSLKACSDIEGDKCSEPWDYCCETDRLPDAMLLVKILDDGGEIVAVDARQLLQAKELQTVVVEGKAKRDKAGNVSVLASGVFIKP